MKNKQFRFVFLTILLVIQMTSGLNASIVLTDGTHDVLNIDEDAPVDFDTIDITEASYLQLGSMLGLSITFVGNAVLSSNYEYYFTIDLLQNTTGIKYANIKLEMKNNISSATYSWNMNGSAQTDILM